MNIKVPRKELVDTQEHLKEAELVVGSLVGMRDSCLGLSDRCLETGLSYRQGWLAEGYSPRILRPSCCKGDLVHRFPISSGIL